MNLIYVPMLKALDAETEALKNLSSRTWEKIIPFFDIPRIPKKEKRPKYLGTSSPNMIFLDKALSRIGSVCAGRMAMIDAYHWLGDASVETGEAVIPYIINQALARGVIAIPVIGYDRWDVESYKVALLGVNFSAAPLTCLRLDLTAIEDSLEPDLFLENIEAMLSDIDVQPSKCAVLIDFGDAFHSKVDDLFSSAQRVINLLGKYDFKFLITSASTLPNTIDKAVPQKDSTARIRRKEMSLWKKVRQSGSAKRFNVIYGDYVIRGPHSNEGVPNPNANVKIRYTIDDHFYIARGHSVSEPDKFSQLFVLAEKIVNSGFYLSEKFSWGDEMIGEALKGKTTKTHAFWISVDTCHHLTYVVAEVEQFVINFGINVQQVKI
ncbi:beta family protein [Nitrosospira sp. NRS527]|uniref:beta family protein n=1 Tax=Nitrosospira sp. NRS527 TaxID=155925 RepID=UPI001AF64585|nr:beta family protein [Nitrosospira sp. NRS527]BCT66547.1 hypothetical protein NNRS527_00110 [Nitrosospira sp. NRS527]